jgi:hypothetical protein
MSELRKAAEMALDALNEVTGWQWGGPMRVMDEVEDAIQALRQALAQQGKECVYPKCETAGGCDGPCGEKPVDETAKRRHEPGLWVVQYKDRHEFVWGAKPVFRGDTVLGLKPLYTAPPKREWVGLTDEEIDKTEWEPSYGNPMTLAEGLQLFARTIEAKLKEKNT